jgi:hypothetical protein
MEWIKITDRLPKYGESVVFKAFKVKFRNYVEYTSDPYCGWISPYGYERWPHKDFLPTHWCNLPETPKD